MCTNFLFLYLLFFYPKMNFLKDTINSEVKKRKAIYSAASKSSSSNAGEADKPRKKYVRVRDLERAEAESLTSSPKKPTTENTLNNGPIVEDDQGGPKLLNKIADQVAVSCFV